MLLNMTMDKLSEISGRMTQLKPHICRLCGSRRDSPSPLKICLGCATVVQKVRRDDDGVCRCPECEERVCGLSFDEVSTDYTKIAGAKKAVAQINQAILAIQIDCTTGG